MVSVLTLVLSISGPGEHNDSLRIIWPEESKKFPWAIAHVFFHFLVIFQNGLNYTFSDVSHGKSEYHNENAFKDPCHIIFIFSKVGEGWVFDTKVVV